MNSLIAIISSIFVNCGSAYLSRDLKEIFDNIFKHKHMRWLVVFFIALSATRDYVVSIQFTLIFVLTFWFFLNQNSHFFIEKENLAK